MLIDSCTRGDQLADSDWMATPVGSFLPWAGFRAGRTFLDYFHLLFESLFLDNFLT